MQVEQMAKHRFESFKLGMPSPTAQVASKHRHARSHSRNASISSIASLPTPKSTTTHEIPPTHSLPPPPKRNSHHRRISSVSTRRESAELMGVSVSDPLISPAEDAGEKDSLRRHALWALEGKRDASYSKVEIPELPTPFEFPSKPSFPPGSGTFMNTAKRDSKRDSFKPSSKDLLGTLVEEEEEDEDSDRPRAPPTPTTPTTGFMRNIAARPRPPHLSLRPLSLTPDNLPSLAPPSQNLPTPLSPRRSSLKTLALAPDPTTTMMNRTTTTPTPLRSRPVLNIKLSAEPPSAVASGSPEETGARPPPPRRSSISYKSSATVTVGLPTPENTPISDRRFSGYSHNNSISSRGSLSSMATTEDDFLAATSAATRPLSVSEQHFLFKSHNALLARITDLERALSFRNTPSSFRDGVSRPSSVASAFSAASGSSSRSGEPSGEPLDEMLSLVSDLKAERDELKRDVEGWRVRVGDMEKQLGVFGSRVEAERRDAWVARSRVGLLEVERSGLEKRARELEAENQRLLTGEEELKQQVARLLEEKEQMAAELQEARNKASRAMDPLSTPRAFDGPVVAVRPIVSAMKRGLGFTSVDSESSVTDVEDSGFQSFGLGLGFKLRAVEEEGDDEDSGLAGYEDEDENDILLSPSSSFGSVDDFYSAGRTVLEVAPESTPAPAPSHVNRPSISKWTFPKAMPRVERQVEEVDRFFGCLEDLDDLPSPSSSSPLYSEYDEEKSKGMFAKGFSYGDETNSCFVLPASVLASVEGTFGDLLDVVEEENEDGEEEGETEGETVVEDGEVNNGIKITFTPPAEDPALAAPSVVAVSPPSPTKRPAFAFFEDEDEDEVDDEAVPFNFGQPRSVTPERRSTPMTPPSSVNARPVSPSSIPRPVMVKPVSFTLASPPSKMNGFATPPTKRGGTPSFIPQPSSPSRTPPFASNASTKPSTTFIRQPARQPLMPNRNISKTQTTNGSAIPRLRSPPHSSPRYAANPTGHQGSDMKSVDISEHNIPTDAASYSTSPSVLASSSFSSIMSSPLAGRLSFQTLTNYIPSWGMTPQTDAAGQDSRVVASPRGFVSKQSQLERLKSRLERESLEGRSAAGKKRDDAAFL
ncbi:hypothetical protein C8R46DRAFT_987240 [Mycena filopes]|nr:hypothetical protein C8R46DRAFT_987240 [Mycena filopes]